MNKISTCLWFDGQAEDATNFYVSIFAPAKILSVTRYTEAGAKMSGQKQGSVMLIDTEIMGLGIQALNGGPIFKPSPSFSYSLAFSSEQELDEAWRQLSTGGEVRMALDKYPWSPKYGWTKDKFGIDWQMSLVPGQRRIVPSLLFTDALFGRGKEAVDFYLSIFANSRIEMMAEEPNTKTIMYCDLTLDGQHVTLMEGSGKHGHVFTHANSFVISCKNQKEIDHFTQKLSDGGVIEDCGWVKDKFGVSWQVVPEFMKTVMTDPAKTEKVMRAMMGMKKLDLAKLENAARSV
jgi:predicted 3-demethylubiquinone-9 3-methyltransferase (glyoxalase superfamily)